jgi:hypothetical protein
MILGLVRGDSGTSARRAIGHKPGATRRLQRQLAAKSRILARGATNHEISLASMIHLRPEVLIASLLSRAINYYARSLLGLKVHDYSGGFRCYRTSALRTLELGRIRSRGYSFQEKIVWHVKHAGSRFCEVPIAFRDRTEGTSKITLQETIGAVWLITRIAFSVRVR